MPRADGRAPDELRSVEIIRHFIPHAEGSVLITLGQTRVVCTATLEERVPPWLRGGGSGWITAEYGMLPRSTHERTPRDPGRQGGRRHPHGTDHRGLRCPGGRAGRAAPYRRALVVAAARVPGRDQRRHRGR